MPFKNHLILKLSCLILTYSLFALPASSASLDFTNSVIVTPPKLERLERKAVTVLREKIHKRTAIQLSTVTQWPRTRQRVIAVGQTEQIKNLAPPRSDILEDDKALEREGFRLSITEEAILVTANDPRGVLYGAGKLLRILRMKPGSILAQGQLQITTFPRYPIRGHQLGYRPKTNAYDAWSPAQFDQYIRELALFGANSIEIIPPRTDDDLTSPHMELAPMEMMIRQSEITFRIS